MGGRSRIRMTSSAVFTGDPDVLHAGEGNAMLEPLLGARSLLLLDGADHMAERKPLLPPSTASACRPTAS